MNAFTRTRRVLAASLAVGAVGAAAALPSGAQAAQVGDVCNTNSLDARLQPAQQRRLDVHDRARWRFPHHRVRRRPMVRPRQPAPGRLDRPVAPEPGDLSPVTHRTARLSGGGRSFARPDIGHSKNAQSRSINVGMARSLLATTSGAAACVASSTRPPPTSRRSAAGARGGPARSSRSRSSRSSSSTTRLIDHTPLAGLLLEGGLLAALLALVAWRRRDLAPHRLAAAHLGRPRPLDPQRRDRRARDGDRRRPRAAPRAARRHARHRPQAARATPAAACSPASRWSCSRRSSRRPSSAAGCCAR